MSYRRPQRTHFFSHETKVSLELPAGWRSLDEEPHAASYVEGVASGQIPAFLLVRVAGATELPEDAHEVLARGYSREAGVDADLDREMEVAGFPARLTAFRHVGDDGRETLHCQAFVRVGDLVYSLLGSAPAHRGEDFRELFAGVLESVRFIPA